MLLVGKLTEPLVVAIKLLLDNGLAVADESLDTWIVKDDEEYCVDGTGREPIEEDFDDVDKAIAYFAKSQRRAIRSY